MICMFKLNSDIHNQLNRQAFHISAVNSTNYGINSIRYSIPKLYYDTFKNNDSGAKDLVNLDHILNMFQFKETLFVQLFITIISLLWCCLHTMLSFHNQIRVLFYSPDCILNRLVSSRPPRPPRPPSLFIFFCFFSFTNFVIYIALNLFILNLFWYCKLVLNCILFLFG